MSKKNIITEQRAFDVLIDVIGVEIEQAQVKLIVAANVQMLLHYWKLGYIISSTQNRLGWGGKVIDTIAKAIKLKHPNKKGYSSRNLSYMCQFSRQCSLGIIKQLIDTDSTM